MAHFHHRKVSSAPHEGRCGPLQDETIVRLPPERPRRIGPLDPGTESRLVQAAQTGDEGARVELLDAFAPLVRSLSRDYPTTSGVGRPELMSSGAAGLLRALERYDAGHDMPFWAYASWWVRHAMQSLFSGVVHPLAPQDHGRGLHG
jgi:RNA polymerase primary sigma factor